MTQGPGDLLYVPVAFVVFDKALNNADVMGVKLVTFVKSQLEATLAGRR